MLAWGCGGVRNGSHPACGVRASSWTVGGPLSDPYPSITPASQYPNDTHHHAPSSATNKTHACAPRQSCERTWSPQRTSKNAAACALPVGTYLEAAAGERLEPQQEPPRPPAPATGPIRALRAPPHPGTLRVLSMGPLPGHEPPMHLEAKYRRQKARSKGQNAGMCAPPHHVSLFDFPPISASHAFTPR
jgi:hypothetical protein